MSKIQTQAFLPEGQWQDDDELRQKLPMSSANDHLEQSFHIRSKSTAQAHSPKRLSMFSGRSRSSTTTSTTSSRRSPASSMTSAETTMQPPYEDRTSSAIAAVPIDRQENVAKSLFMRGSRILRRQGSKFNIAATLDEEYEVGKATQKFEVADFFRSHKGRQNDTHEQLKRIISEPYDFHHLTHTSPAQFQALDNTSKNDLVTEFSAIRASQKPVTELKGIRAKDLYYNNFSEDLGDPTANGGRWAAQSPPAASPPVSPRSPNTRESRAIENFSRPVSRLNKPLPSPSMVSPPRSSSRQVISVIPGPASRAIDEIFGLNSPSTVPDFLYSYDDDDDDDIAETLSLDRIDLADVFQLGMGHALTVDDSRVTSTAVINSYLSDLEDVPEEDETHLQNVTYHNDPQRSISPSIYEEDCNPAVATSSNGYCESVLVIQDKPMSLSDALMSPTLPQFCSIRDESPVSQAGDMKRRQSVGREAPDFDNFPISWDEDIDYCYEHAAESNCDFDWHRISLEVPRVAVADMSPAAGADHARLPLSSRSLYHLHTADSAPATPDLDPGSALSVLSRSHEAVTPLAADPSPAELFVRPRVSNQCDYFKNVDSQILHATVDKNLAQHAMYEDFLAAGDDSDRHFFPQSRSHSVDMPISPRSSYSPISKCNSQESIILSRAASIVRKHRSSTSTTSVPELVPSANSSRENTIRESIVSIEQGTFGSVPDSVRQGLPTLHHRQAKSLASELGILSSLRATRSSGSIDVVDVPYPLVSPTHDRTKSASAAEHEASNMNQNGEGLPFATRMQSAPLAQRRKSRTSYSLFPASMAPSPRR